MNEADTQHKITIFGHRGARGIFPENTMVGFRYLREIGIDDVEVDVQNAAGRTPVVVHDPYISQSLARDCQGGLDYWRCASNFANDNGTDCRTGRWHHSS